MSSKGNPSTIKKGQKFGKWTLEEAIGEGGNGEVWLVSKTNDKSHALKLLKSVTPESYERFKIEIDALEKLGSTPGIVPLIDKHLPEKKEGKPWFVMPIAMPFEKYIKGKKPKTIIQDFIELALTIDTPHQNSISHRDIKPANFLYFKNRLCLSDFGLVKYPERENITPPKRDVGAKFTMAPEMRRHASRADGLAADVYSFAKSLWIALTGKELGFDGQYNSASPELALKTYLPDIYTTTLDRLLYECTDTDPSLRPPIALAAKRLQEWLAIIENFHTRNLTEWTELTQKLFPLGAPARTTWTEIDIICAVLSEIAKVPALNHMFYPTGGGNTITGVRRTTEERMIELLIGDGTAEILRPKKLTYESFGHDTSWTYFRLEVDTLKPTGIKEALSEDGIREDLMELGPGKYISYSTLEKMEYHDEPLPESPRSIGRYLKGSFVFFSTRSAYNGDTSTYDARHNKMTEKEFRKYIQKNSQP
ncbi:protein kinase [Pseudomonas gingeri]|uniref:protein kinase domain-containing protein n=1 Tax=Pseudomonas gingeri TaxID=117681 RepID=UPI0015A18E9B|nr:protein kinase [Pseudomonas gingeri]NWA24598.1 protein kinase [Pseudomonas gingeri]